MVATVCILALICAVFLNVSATNPPGFNRDESAIAYNAYTLSTTGDDEYGAHLPLFIRSFGDYKSPLYIYLLAAVFRVTGPSTEVARWFAAVLGLAGVLVLYALALAVSRRQIVALSLAMLVGLSPWLFDISRTTSSEAALLPLLLALFLLVVHRASTGPWRWWHSALIGSLLAAVAYTYSGGRILAPSLAIGLVLCWFRHRWRQLAVVWGVFLVAIAPIGVWAHLHPAAFQARYQATTFVVPGMPWTEIVRKFLANYATNLNLWGWLVHGDPDPTHQPSGTGSLFYVEVALVLAGAAVVLLRRRSDPWWQFVLFGVFVSPAAASITVETFQSVRMVALPVFLPLLALPALELLAALPSRRAIAAGAALLGVFAVEAVHWQVVYHRNGPDRQAAFDVSGRAEIQAALNRGGTVYAFRHDHSVYIHLLLDRAIENRSPSSAIVLDDATRPPVGGFVLGLPGECPQCPAVGGNDAVEEFTYEPARPGVVTTSFQLTSPLRPVGGPVDFLVGVHNTGAQPVDHIMLHVELPPAMLLAGPPYHDHGPGCTGPQTIVCNIGWLPAGGQATIRYEVQVTESGPQTMVAAVTTDELAVNPVGTASAFTVDLTPPAYGKSSPPPGRATTP